MHPQVAALSVLSMNTKTLRTLKWNKENPEKYRANKKAYRGRNLERFKAWNKAYRLKHAKRLREKQKKYKSRPEIKEHYRQYGILYRQRKHEKIAGKKPDKCPVCKRKSKKICLDHCHKTGKIRGWLCDPCNVALGRVEDQIYILKNLIKYLKKNVGKKVENSNGE